jgi:2-polyprenyl-3-methyl-5-hydroxy-6-metoxy-1,4-benzoquinol methylase
MRCLADLRVRRREPEIMDQPNLAPERHAQALRALARVNALSRVAGALWPPIRAVTRRRPAERLRLLDVACGGGDLAIALWKKARRAGIDLQVDAADASPVAIAYATLEARKRRAPIRFFEHDFLQAPFPQGYDIVTSSLFLHHLEEAQAVELLTRMRRARPLLLLIDDLLRTPIGYALARVGTRLLTRSDVARVDGPLSVQGAFTIEEVEALAERASLDGFTLTRHWPERFLFEWHGR